MPKAHTRRTFLTTASAVATLGALAASGAVRPVVAAGEPTFPAEVQAALDAILARATAPGTNPGVIAGAWVAGRGSWTRAVGVSDIATGAPIALVDKIRIASITKTFVGVAVLQLVDDGRLTLDDRLDRYVPDIANGDRITIRQLLNMTAGVYNYTEDQSFLDAYEADPLLPFTPQDVLAIIRRHEANFAPGASFHYSDSQYTLLGLIVEQVTGQPLPEVIARRVLAPLGLTTTSFPTTPPIPAPYARGYLGGKDGAPLKDLTVSNPNVAWAAGAMLSNLEDLRVWAKALARGWLLRPETFHEQLTWIALQSTPVDVRYGLGILSFDGFLGHNGGIFGYSSFAVHHPEIDATVVVLVNRGGLEGGDADAIFFEIAQTLFPDRVHI
jgi:D-alanyl-D-alanine carboxypeptidase